MKLIKYADLKLNDIANGPGVNVSFWVQGCPIHCPECQNPETWDVNGGKEFTSNTLNTILKALIANGVKRNLSILGGEPLCDENLFLTELIIREVKKVYPEIKIYLWTGYLYNDLLSKSKNNTHLDYILSQLDKIVEGPFKIEERDITLLMRGSRNQQIIDLKKKL